LDPEQDAPIRSFSMLQQTIEDAMAQRVLKPGDALCTAHLFWSFVHGLASLYIATPKGSFPAPIEMLYAQGMNHLMDGLAERRP
ncbi:MAG: TetR-like C-terminal domain-containing protein, partial [Myxococcota bacterium]